MMAASAIELQPYVSLDDDDCEQRIRKAKRTLGDRIVNLGHHYQRMVVWDYDKSMGGLTAEQIKKSKDDSLEGILFSASNV